MPAPTIYTVIEALHDVRPSAAETYAQYLDAHDLLDHPGRVPQQLSSDADWRLRRVVDRIGSNVVRKFPAVMTDVAAERILKKLFKANAFS